MAAVGIRGLVRAARLATEGLRAGLTEAERPAFAERLRRDLRWVDEFLSEEGLVEADLPAPSRRAVEALRRIAAIPPTELPTRPEGSAVAEKLRIPGAEGDLDRFLESLECGSTPPEEIERMRARARAISDAMEDACRAAGGEAGALTVRSRRAFAMLRWLSEGQNLDRYAETVTSAVRVLPRSLADAGLAVSSETRVRVEPGPRLWAVHRSVEACHWHLSPGFLAADEGDFEALALVAALRRKAPGAAQDRIHALLESEDFVSTVAEVERIVAPRESRACGRAHDLDALFDRLDSTFFHGSLARPRMEWAPTLSRHRFGFYVFLHDIVCMNPLLDDPSVPASVVEFVLYHELLHKKHGGRWASGRRHVHTPEFRAEERLHPHFEEADRVTRALARDPTPAAPPPRPPNPPHPPQSPPLALGRGSGGDDPVPPIAPPRVLASPPRVGRNDPCPCGSGRKWKRCHLGREEAPASHPRFEA